RALGLDSMQLSLQDVTVAGTERIAGRSVLQAKLEAARWTKDLGIPLTLNVVLHRENLARVAEFVALGESLEAGRLELATQQHLGWALTNRRALLPTREQLDAARTVAMEGRRRLRGRTAGVFGVARV